LLVFSAESMLSATDVIFGGRLNTGWLEEAYFGLGC
jgi:hypothetical protein